MLKTITDLIAKIFRMGRNSNYTIRYYVDNITWELTVEENTSTNEMTEKGDAPKYLCFKVKIKEGKLMDEYLGYSKQVSFKGSFNLEFISYDMLNLIAYNRDHVNE